MLWGVTIVLIRPCDEFRRASDVLWPGRRGSGPSFEASARKGWASRRATTPSTARTTAPSERAVSCVRTGRESVRTVSGMRGRGWAWSTQYGSHDECGWGSNSGPVVRGAPPEPSRYTSGDILCFFVSATPPRI